MFYHLFCINRKETISTFLKKQRIFKTSLYEPHLRKQLLYNLLICLEGLLNCICTHVSIKVNVFIQKNVYHIHNYVHKSMKNWKLIISYSFLR